MGSKVRGWAAALVFSAVQGLTQDIDAQLADVLNGAGFTGAIQSTLPVRLGRPVNSKLAALGRLLFFDPRQPYRMLRQLRDELRHSGFELDTLSAGMSDDLEAAIAEGSTLVRIGTAIFGRRSEVQDIRSRIETIPSTRPPSTTGRWRKRPSIMSAMASGTLVPGAAVVT